MTNVGATQIMAERLANNDPENLNSRHAVDAAYIYCSTINAPVDADLM